MDQVTSSFQPFASCIPTFPLISVGDHTVLVAMKTPVILCTGLHVVLVLIYTVVLVLTKFAIFSRPLYLPEDTSRVVVTLVIQSFTIAYCAALLFFTQRIALYDIVAGRQTLSAIHDKSSAWLGLISSLSVLSNQRKHLTDLIGVLIITLYLVCILVVHTTLPATFSVGIVNVTIASAYPTTLARQSTVLDSFHNETYFTPLHAILSVYDAMDISTVGLRESTLYDIIPVVENAANAGVTVNSTTISVDCSPIPDVVQTGFHINGSYSSSSTLDVENNPSYDLTFGGGKYTTSITPIPDGNLQVVAPYVVSNDVDRGLIFYHVNPSMLLVAYNNYGPIVDSSGSLAPMLNTSVYPPWQDSLQDMTTSINLLGCNFAIRNTSTEVNAQTREIVKPPAPSTQAMWHNWTDPDISQDPLIAQPLMYFAANSGFDAFNFERALTVITNTTNVTVSNLITSLDTFLTLDMSLSQNVTDASHFSNATLADLNRSLAKAYAAVLWYNNVQKTTIVRSSNERQQGEALIPAIELQVRIIINMFSLALGLGSSCILLALSIVLICRTRHVRKQDGTLIDSTGLLPMLWLLGNEPSLKHIPKPDLDALRAAGMYEVAPMEARMRAVSPNSDDEKEGKFSQPQDIYISLARAASRESYSSTIG